MEDSDREKLMHLYEQAQIDYARYFLYLYIAFNAWYRIETHKTKDSEALALLEYAYSDYWPVIKTEMGECSKMTWGQMLRHWYMIRCRIAHGAHVEQAQAQLAYDSLSIFMCKVISSTRNQLSVREERRLEVVSALLNRDESTIDILKQLHATLSARYMHQ